MPMINTPRPTRQVEPHTTREVVRRHPTSRSAIATLWPTHSPSRRRLRARLVDVAIRDQPQPQHRPTLASG